MIQKEEFMKAHGFAANYEADWLNRTQRIWVSHEVVAESSLSELDKIGMNVPSGEFHFYSKASHIHAICINHPDSIEPFRFEACESRVGVNVTA